MSAGVAKTVRSFYERHPYPPPVDSLEKYRRLWQDRAEAPRRLPSLLARPALPGRPLHPDRRLRDVAGGQARLALARGPGDRHRLQRDERPLHRGAQAQVRPATISRSTSFPSSGSASSARRFDQIVCTGVLHHLADPDAGLAALRDVLEPDGAMHLMVYAPYGRTGIYMLQEFCRRVGIRATDEEIRDLVAALGALPPGHPLGTLLREAPDFRQEAALADALLHPQDRAYSVPQLFEFLEQGRADVRPLGQAGALQPALRRHGAHPAGGAASRSCPLPEQYAAVELFRGTMVRHSAIVYRDDDPGGSRPLSFAGDAWPGYVPIRMPDTICVAGAAASRRRGRADQPDPHLHGTSICRSTRRRSDCSTPSTGSAPSARSPGRTGISTTSRAFFERLWRYDQVVFDASR